MFKTVGVLISMRAFESTVVVSFFCRHCITVGNYYDYGRSPFKTVGVLISMRAFESTVVVSFYCMR